MESKIVSELNLKFHPVAIIWSDEKPENALQFKPRKWGCVMSLFAHAAKGHTAVFDRGDLRMLGRWCRVRIWKSVFESTRRNRRILPFFINGKPY